MKQGTFFEWIGNSGLLEFVIIGLILFLSACPNPMDSSSVEKGNSNGGSGVNAGYAGPLVTNNANSGPGSLRAVVAEAAPGEEIRFLNDMIITLSGDRRGILIDKDVRINGINVSVTITTEGNQRHFTYMPGVGYQLSLSHLILKDGRPQNPQLLPGGSLYVGPGGVVQLNNVVFDSNLGTLGGAIFVEENSGNPATLTLTNTVFLRNEARGDSASTNAALRGAGGAIYQRYGTLSIIEGMFEENFVAQGHNANFSDGISGGAIFARELTATIMNTEFTENHAGRLGGAIMSFDSDIDVVSSSFVENRASITGTQGSLSPMGGGAIFALGNSVSNAQIRIGLSHFLRNSAIGPNNGSSSNVFFIGGAIGTRSAVDLTIHGSEFFGNRVADDSDGIRNTGGAIYFGGGLTNTATLEMSSVALVGNTASGSYGVDQMGVGGVDARGTTNTSVHISFVSFWNNRQLTTTSDDPLDLRIDADGYYISDTAFGAAGWTPEEPDLFLYPARVIERVVGPFSEFDEEAYQEITDEGVTRQLGNINQLPLVALHPSSGADGIWGTNDDYYGDLIPIFSYEGSNLFNKGRMVGLPNDHLDLNGDGSVFDSLPVDAAGNPRKSGAHPDIGAYEQQL
jgi:hypothetical protein